jgi:hypothetical protein
VAFFILILSLYNYSINCLFSSYCFRRDAGVFLHIKFFKYLLKDKYPWWQRYQPVSYMLDSRKTLLHLNKHIGTNPVLKGLSHEIDFKNFEKNLQNLV